MKCIIGVLLFFVFARADAALIDRGGGFIYDDVQDITWTQNANIERGTFLNRGTLAFQMAWADGLSIYDSVRDVIWDDWRLPTTLQPDASCSVQWDEYFIRDAGLPPQGIGYGCTGSEMGHLFNVDGISSSSPGPFTNITNDIYWSGTRTEIFDPYVWVFSFLSGRQDWWFDTYDINAWAVRDGDVAPVPVPAAVWLFGSALGLLGWMRRKNI